MIIITKTVEVRYYLDENKLEEFANRNGYDPNELNEAIDNDELDVEWLCEFQDETTVNYKVERD